jgi:ElaB/YqjD/DUF883 family membrane-anchored ribosome-binding protein
MPTVHADPLTASDRVADVIGRPAHVAHEARVLKTIAADAVEDAVHAARRAATRTGRDIEAWRETAAYRIKKAPFVAVAIAAGIGLLVGVASGRCIDRAARARPRNEPKIS